MADQKSSQKGRDHFFLIIFVLVTLWYWFGVANVPFHPDESTNIFMSADFETLFTDPLSLAWQPENPSPHQLLRLLDAPLARYLVGAGRSIAGLQPTRADWNWSKSWAENQAAGALPGPKLLTTARLGPAALFPFSLFLVYFAGKRLGGRGLGLVAGIFFASNALILLHTRRAMAESGLIFTICLFLACLVVFQKKTWLIAIPAALAFCAKHSTLPLAAVGLLAVLLYELPKPKWLRLGINLGSFILIWVTIVFAFNPILWKDPFGALNAAISARQTLQNAQTEAFNGALPDAVLRSPEQVILSLIANQFIVPPAISDVGNYADQIRVSADHYLENPLHQLARGLVFGGLMLALALLGFLFAIMRMFRPIAGSRLPWLLINLAGLLQFFALAVTITLPFQRYVLPITPFVCLWTGLCVQQFWHIVSRKKSTGSTIS